MNGLRMTILRSATHRDTVEHIRITGLRTRSKVPLISVLKPCDSRFIAVHRETVKERGMAARLAGWHSIAASCCAPSALSAKANVASTLDWYLPMELRTVIYWVNFKMR